MTHAHHITTIQLGSLLIAAATLGACTTIMAAQAVLPSARASTIEHAKNTDEPAAAITQGKAKTAHPVTHFEIGCRDSAKTKDFYAKLFDWQVKTEGPMNSIETGGEKGIGGHITSLGHEPQHYVTVYVEVENIKTYLDKATALGGKTIVPAIKIPTGSFAWLSDPDGNIIGLLQTKKP